MRAALFVVFAQSSSCHHHALGIVDAARRGPRAPRATRPLAALTSGMSKSDAKLLAFAAELRDAAVGLQTAVDAARGMDHVSLPADGAVSASDVVDYARRISYTTFAPAGYAPGGPLHGIVPPAPQDEHFAASHLARHAAEAEAREERAWKVRPITECCSGVFRPPPIIIQSPQRSTHPDGVRFVVQSHRPIPHHPTRRASSRLVRGWIVSCHWSWPNGRRAMRRRRQSVGASSWSASHPQNPTRQKAPR